MRNLEFELVFDNNFLYNNGTDKVTNEELVCRYFRFHL